MSDGLTLLDGIRVVALEQYIAGPYCTSILADAGAEVVKVEIPGSGDPRRNYDPRIGPAQDHLSGGFASYNRGKRSVELALGEPRDRAVFEDLVESADVLVCNLRPGALSRHGYDPQDLRSRYPSLIVCEITGFGATGGEYASWPAFDSVIQGMSGLASLIGDAGAPPGLAPMATTDLLAGVYAAVGVLTALVNRARTGRGCHVDAAMYDIGAAFLERPLTLHEFTGAVASRGADEFSPVGVFRAGDGGWVSIVIPTDDMWRRCCHALHRPELEHDPDLDTVLKRAANMHSRIIPALEDWAGTLTRAQAAEALRAAGQPAGPVQSVDEVRACPHLEHRGLFVDLDDDRATAATRRLRLPRLPLLFDAAAAVPGPVPRLGADNEVFGVRAADGEPVR